MKKLLITLLLLVANVFGQAYAGPNDSPGWGPHDDYSIKPTFTEDRHRCEDPQIKHLLTPYSKIGSWNAEYTLVYMTNSIVKDGSLIKVHCKLFTTIINQSSAGSSEGYVDTDVTFNTRTKQMLLSGTSAVSCKNQLIGRYNQSGQWEPINGIEIFNTFYHNVAKKF